MPFADGETVHGSFCTALRSREGPLRRIYGAKKLSHQPSRGPFVSRSPIGARRSFGEGCAIGTDCFSGSSGLVFPRRCGRALFVRWLSIGLRAGQPRIRRERCLRPTNCGKPVLSQQRVLFDCIFSQVESWQEDCGWRACGVVGGCCGWRNGVCFLDGRRQQAA